MVVDNNTYKDIFNIINSLPLTPVEKLKNDIFREYYDEYDTYDDLLSKLKEDIKYLEETAEEAMARSKVDKFSIKLKEKFWNYEIGESEDGVKFLMITLFIKSEYEHYGNIGLPIMIFQSDTNKFIYYEATEREEDLKGIKILARGRLIDRIKNYFKNRKDNTKNLIKYLG